MDIQIWIDERGALGAWGNTRRALAHCPAGATHLLLLRDDIAICRDFLASVCAAIAVKPDVLISFFGSRERLISRSQERGDAWCVVPDAAWLYALAIPVGYIPGFLKWEEQYWAAKFDRNHDDLRFMLYNLAHGIETWVTVPSLVQHRDNEIPSLKGNAPRPSRTARSFIGEDRSGLEISFDRGLDAPLRDQVRVRPDYWERFTTWDGVRPAALPNDDRKIPNGPAPHQQVWASALTLPWQPNLVTSLIAELAEYLGMPFAQVEAMCRSGKAILADAWQDAAPSSADDIDKFYQQTNGYLFDLTWWHRKGGRMQVEALQHAQACRAKTVLDFGSGIGSLGLLYAQHGMDVTLADVNPHLNDYARWRFDRRGLTARIIDLRGEELPTGTFEFVSAVDVLEHLPDLASALTAISTAMTPEGSLYVHFPTEISSAHPMHLWPDHSEFLACLPKAGLELHHAAGPNLLLKKV